MRPIRDLAARYGLWVLEDATESLGATYEGVPVGHLGEAACLSFNGNKLITTGGGGMVVTDDARVADRARYLSTQAKDDPVEYVHGAIGFNYRLSNVQAAIGVAQLERLDRFIAVKRAIAERYAAGLGHVDGLVLPNEAPWARSAFWLYTVLVREEEFGMSSRELLACLQRAGIDSRPLWRPLPRLGHLDDHPAVGVEVADRLHAEALSLPSSVGLDAERQRCVIDTIIEASGGRR
jgi:dTDP-4-amino-4,6-dideoxygalactose transaminase